MSEAEKLLTKHTNACCEAHFEIELGRYPDILHE